jgi:glycosyltransferase involved in cell wall biosynthesis
MENARITHRALLVFDGAYTYQMLKQRNLFDMVTCRDLNGYFSHVWTVHPVASIFEQSSAERFGRYRVHRLSNHHTFIEGKIGRYAFLQFFPVINFALSQLSLGIGLFKLTKKYSPAVVRAEDPYMNGILALLFSLIYRCPLIIGVWGNPGAIRAHTRKPLMPRLFRTIYLEEIVERFTLRRATRVLIQNEDNRTFVLGCGVHRAQTALFRISNALDKCHRVAPELRFSGTPDLLELGIRKSHVLICISRLEKLKLVDHFLFTVRELVCRNLDVDALVVGDGPDLERLKQISDALGIRPRVYFCGNRDQEWISRVLGSVQVVIAPLAGRALGEAALAGAAVVAYDIDWHSEIIEDGVSGRIVPYLDHSALAIATEELILDPPRANEFGKNLRKKALELLDNNSAINAQRETYDEVLQVVDKNVVLPSI